MVTLEPIPKAEQHTHEEYTVHVILKGELHITDKKGKTKIYKKGDRVDFPVGTTHRAAFGSKGCTMIIGVK